MLWRVVWMPNRNANIFVASPGGYTVFKAESPLFLKSMGDFNFRSRRC